MNTIYKKYKERFIQISGRNRSLFLKDIVKKYSYDIGEILENRSDVDEFFDFLWHNKRSYNLMNEKAATRLIKSERPQPIANGTAEEEVKKTRLTKDKLNTRLQKEIASLKYLKREVDELENETGRSELFIGYPFVIGNLAQDVQIKAPLLLFPVQLEIEKDEAIISLVPTQPIIINKALILAYTKEHNIKAKDIIQEFDPLQEGSFESAYDVIDYLNNHGFKLRYTKRKGLTSFNLPQNYMTDGLEVKSMAVLGRFPLANSIYNDYLALEKDNLTSPSIEMLLSPQPPKRIPKLTFKRRQTKTKDDSFYEIHDLDYAQENALKQLTQNENIVIYGPPGTGKSQTIANIISDALCKQKKVLVVSQKRAALDVVFNRLGKLNSKAMLIPDPEKDKAKFFERVREMHDTTSNMDFDESKLRHIKVEKSIQNELDILKGISDTLFTKTPFGLTLQEMYAASYNIGKDNKDYEFYNKMKETSILYRDYPELSDDMRLIRDKNIDSLYVTYKDLVAVNEMVVHILPSIDMHQLKEARLTINEFLKNSQPPFDVTKYPHCRYLMTFYLEDAAEDRRSIAKVAKLVTDIEHPSASRWLEASKFPLLWPLYPFAKYKYEQLKEDIKIDLNIAKHALETYEEKYKVLNKVLTPQGFSLAIGGLINGNLAFLRKLQTALDNYIKIRDMYLALNSLSDEIKELLDFAYELSDKTIDSFRFQLEKIIPIRIYDEIIKNNDHIEDFLSKTVTFEELRKRILSLKADQREISKKLAIDVFAKEYAEFYQTSLGSKDFLYEIQKQRALRPIRIMFEYFEGYLLRLFPCWLLSPEVVSTILPLKPNMFDLVVFDEASQIFIESALPAIYRGSKVVVAGDSKQLRPTAGFVKRYFGDDSLMATVDLATQAALEVESLLDLATARYSPVYLSYHYRSKYAELIDFSNAAFYDNKLQIAPNTTRHIGNETPIERIMVKGLWQGRRNHEEAVGVVKLIKKIFAERELNESIGVVTFNVEQKEYIEDLLDAEAEKNKVFAKQLNNEKSRIENGENVSIFVKNLENVQGEERDIIIFSIGYAKNDYDKVVAQFGTLSMEGGENRLNVAITRARKKVYVITSIEPEELDRVETTKNRGPKLLKRYLQYVRAVSDNNQNDVKQVLKALYVDKRELGTVGHYEAQIKEALEEAGYTVDINLGNTKYKLSLAVYDGELGRYVLGIECDYQAFYASDSLLERDVYRFKFLESKGWKIIRVWSRDWWISRKKVLDQIVEAITKEKEKIKEKMLKNQ